MAKDKENSEDSYIGYPRRFNGIKIHEKKKGPNGNNINTIRLQVGEIAGEV